MCDKFFFDITKLYKIFATKYAISTPLMMENPVRSPIVPPIAESMSTNFAARSLVILSNDGVLKKIVTSFKFASVGGPG